VSAFGAEGLDVGASSLGDPQPVQGEQGDQGVLGWGAETGGDQQRAYTLLLLPERAAEGQAELATLGLPPPP